MIVIVVWTFVRFLSITTKCDFASHKWQGELYYMVVGFYLAINTNSEFASHLNQGVLDCNLVIL